MNNLSPTEKVKAVLILLGIALLICWIAAAATSSTSTPTRSNDPCASLPTRPNGDHDFGSDSAANEACLRQTIDRMNESN